MQSKIAVLILLFFLIPFPTTAQSGENGAMELYQIAQRSYFELKNDQKLTQNLQAWKQVVATYKMIIDRYPDDPIVDDIIFVSGSVYREMYQTFGDRDFLDQAIAHYRTILREYPESYLQQAALFTIGDIQETHLKSPDLAIATYDDLISRFPKGYKTNAAKEKKSALLARLKPEPEKEERKPDTDTPAVVAESKPETREIKEEPLVTSVEEPKVTQVESRYTSRSPKRDDVIITDIRTSFGQNNGRVVIELDGEIDFFYKQLPAPNRRIYFDLDKVNLLKSPLKSHEIPISNAYLKKIRMAQNSKTTTRVVFDFSNFREYKVFTLPGPADHFRIVFDLYGAGKGPTFVSAGDNIRNEPQTSTNRETPMGDGAAKNSNGKYSLTRQLGAKIRTVIIDPGHGGKDPGAIGFGGLTEKNLNLGVARKVQELFDREYPEVTVKLTRDNDKFIELDQRPAAAKVLEGDIFVSLHSNATRRGKSSGIETYYLNFASDAEAEALAAKENALSRLNQAKLQDLVKKITTNNKKEESRELAYFVQSHLYKQAKPVNSAARNRGVRHAPFVVLIGTNVPSVLIEIGFINHKIEGKLLLQKGYQDRIARGIFNGIKAYIESLK